MKTEATHCQCSELGMNHMDIDGSCADSVVWQLDLASGVYGVGVTFPALGLNGAPASNGETDGCLVQGQQACPDGEMPCVYYNPTLEIITDKLEISGKYEAGCHSIAIVTIVARDAVVAAVAPVVRRAQATFSGPFAFFGVVFAGVPAQNCAGPSISCIFFEVLGSHRVGKRVEAQTSHCAGARPSLG